MPSSSKVPAVRTAAHAHPYTRKYIVYLPDISIICGDIIAAAEDEDTAVLPAVLIEILSLSAKDYDRGGKFRRFRDIPSLKE